MDTTAYFDGKVLGKAMTTAIKFMDVGKYWHGDYRVETVVYLHYDGSEMTIMTTTGKCLFCRTVMSRGGYPAWDKPALIPFENVHIILDTCKGTKKHNLVGIDYPYSDTLSVQGEPLFLLPKVAGEVCTRDVLSNYNFLEDSFLRRNEYYDSKIPAGGVDICTPEGWRLLADAIKACGEDTDDAHGIVVRRGRMCLGNNRYSDTPHWEFSGGGTKIVWMATNTDPEVRRRDL